VLSAEETTTAESLLADALGVHVAVRSAEKIWGRSHILRLRLGDGRSVVLKRRRTENFGDRDRGFDAELASLEFLNVMETAIAPRLLGADTATGILMMEDLGPASSLAHSLLAHDRARAEADLIAYGRALGTMHAWSFGRAREFAEIRARHVPPDVSVAADASVAAGAPDWMDAIVRGKEPFLQLSAQLGLPGEDVSNEIDSLGSLLRGTRPPGGYTALVHSDACPDNTQITDGVCRIFDFETSGWGPVALDAAYLLAPFPSCWCFARLPSDVTAPAIRAYRDAVTSAGVELGPDWDAAMAAALAGWVVARGAAIGRTLADEDREWGTTTMRPRLLTWLRSFTDTAARAAVLPRLRSLAETLHEQLSLRWPETVVPDYPALARPGASLARLPPGWESAS
jgi:hypothetical protein